MQEIIYISRKRLCKQSHIETREKIIEVLEKLKDIEPELVSVCVPECVYRNGFCPEFISCGWNKSDEFMKVYKDYIKGYEKQIRYIGE